MHFIDTRYKDDADDASSLDREIYSTHVISGVIIHFLDI